MLLHLQMKNLAVIDLAEVEFSAGLNIISGETGAGKSMVIDALELVLGGRASAELIRTGKEEAEVTALFDMKDRSEMQERLESHGFPVEGDRLLIHRTINRAGKNKIFINGSLATLSLLDQICQGLVEISSQEERQSILQPHYQLEYVDRLVHLGPKRSQYEGLYQKIRDLNLKRQEILSMREERKKEMEFLAFSIEELEGAKLQPGEEEELRNRKKAFQNRERMRELASSLADAMGRLEVGTLRPSALELAKLEGDYQRYVDQLEQIRFQIEELAYAFQRAADALGEESLSLKEIEERLAVIARLQRKYGGTGETFQHLEGIRKRYAVLQREEFEVEEIEKELSIFRPKLMELADALSSARSAALLTIKVSVERELAALGLSRAILEPRMASFSKEGGPLEIEGVPYGPAGKDRIDFYLSANVGEEPKLLSKVASGGERSRILLALKTILGHEGDIAVYVFDEVDVGIGGPIAEVVGRKISQLARKNQVICITHWPQIAVFADSHFLAVKALKKETTVARLRALTVEQRLVEIARMLGGVRVTATTRTHAVEMMNRARAQTR